MKHNNKNKNEEKSKKNEGDKTDKKEMPVKNTVTDSAKNTASQTPGLNQEKITRDDVFPSDGDNLTS